MENIIISKDLLWKGIVESLFEDFLYYFFPDWTKNEVDFTKPFEFLDKELDKIYTTTKENVKNADKLVKVFLKNGTEKYILLHIEVQGYEDKAFDKRMFTTFYRLFDRFDKNIMAFALYTDEIKDYKPDSFVYKYQQTNLIYQFKTFKVLDYSLTELDVKDNIFSLVMLSVRNALDKNGKKDLAQLKWKIDLVKRLLKSGYNNEKIRYILHFIRSYINFESEKINQELESEINNIIKTRKNMGIEEIIKQEAFRQGEVKGEAIGEARGEAKGEAKGKAEGEAKAKAEAEIKREKELQSIIVAMLEDGFTDEKIMKLLHIDNEFLLKAKKSIKN
ncbi:MAG: hypothetical protein EAY69_08920, partial [Cytophagales bacterium]